ncbi:MAG TPA: response regulator transcription factor [Bacteroidales bacterium]|nr:response regulator transcription factor [Bacteroidales bacterium]
MENLKFSILLVDDESDILEFLGYNLSKEGYNVYKAKSAKEGLKIALEIKPHLIVLDVMMPEMDGIEACREIKQNKLLEKTIVIFLTARAEDYSQIAGLEAGADDYITKPVKPRVFLSKVKSLLRRFNRNEEEAASQKIIDLGNIVINREKYAVFVNEKEHILPRKEFEIIALLASKPHKVFTREEIFQSIWGNSVVGDRTIDVHIRRIREKLNIDNITTIKGIGYKFEI